ncbi:hypothetical protein HZH66_012320 [Vespula vulgaris]|uniref:Protein cueball n=1 Tax=Vespula vulgaris TaxID=7454 RepID=A0A834MVJ6_VESVU|nr:hypothetical protein HZH66_012320 [Vespula vulgaris]
MSRQSRDFLTAFVFFIVLAVFTITSDARSWDIAVVIGDEIDFFSRNQTLTGEATVAGAVSLTGIAYDDKTRTLYLSDTRNNISIFSNDLTKKNLTSKPLLKKQDGTHIVAIAFDTSSRTLFWSDALKRLIMKMRVPMNGPPEEPVLLHNLTQIPRGIVLDMCNSHVYWTNSDNDNPTIERSNMDGTNRTIIIRGNLYEPMGLAIDHDEGKLYWSDDEEEINNPFISPSIRILSTGQIGDADPNAVIARDNVGTIDCLAILKRRLEKKKLPEKQRKGPLLESYNNLTTSTEEVEPENFRLCLNGGSFDRIERSCRCKSGYMGSICETSLCQNYCLHGDCIVNSFGEAECKCIGTFTGKRCERDICEGYCLHDGECSLQNNTPFCKCKYSKGGRCEILTDMPTVNVDTFSCRCTENNHTSEKMLALDENCESKTLLFVLIALIIVLIILILVMSFYLHKLRRRPRIKKRFVVSKGGITPLTSRPQLTDNQCEITIENCCNMNICETPCFEPKLRTPMSRSNNTKKDEKNSLLDNMEGNSC